ncbi:hypothetical protein BJX96DRAFT_156198 [Aspergillus floccosus]
MGSSLSIQSRDKRRRSNRLSKPPSNLVTLSSSIHGAASQPISPSSSPASSTPVDWQNPWTGASVPVTSPGTDFSGRRSQSFPSASIHSERPRVTTGHIGRSQSIVKEKVDRSPTSSSSTSRSLSQRASFQPAKQTTFQPTTLWSEPPSPLGRPGPPKRSYSVQSPPRRSNATIYGSMLEDAASSNTHFMVDNQGFSLIRRRSLLTRPGIATRRSTRQVVQRLPSPIDQEAGFAPTEPLYGPLPDHGNTLSLPPFRPPTPGDFEYTHLGALKLGSLRVVNCSTSPCPSDRSRLTQARSPSPVHGERRPYTSEEWPFRGEFQSLERNLSGPGSSDGFELIRKGSPDLDVMALATECPSDKSRALSVTSLDHGGRSVPVSVLENGGDCPSAPGPFVESSATNLPQRYPSKSTDEGISVSDEDRGSTAKAGGSTQGETKYSPSRTHRKVDSGYSSATSVRSLQDARIRASIDSQASAQLPRSRRFTLGSDSGKPDLSRMKPSADLGKQLPLNRHLSLHGPRTHTSDPSAWSTSLSSMCLETFQIPAGRRPRSSSSCIPQGISRAQSLSRYCAQLRNIEAAPLVPLAVQQTAELQMADTEDSVYGSASSRRLPSSSADGGLPDLSPDMGYIKPGEVSSETTGHDKTHAVAGLRRHKSFSRSRCTGTVASEGVDMTILPAHDLPRGRARSRNDEYQRRRLSKPQKRSNLYMTTSPFIFH